ncbi:MAG: Phosphoheptose isomerase [Chlamydiae bacterium]|nr:Phosphoheptose isomerase [Chlamydiota bacterium]
MSFLDKRLAEFFSIVEKTAFYIKTDLISKDEAFESIYGLFKRIKLNHNKIFVIGNGGSAGIASHHVVDLLNVLNVPAYTLSDNNLVTCMANDYGYDTVFSRPLKSLASKNDLLIAISSSGQSKNILNACEVMKEQNGKVLTLSGFKEENPLKSLGHLNIWCNAMDYGLVESAHFFILHTLVDGWKQFSPLKELLEKNSMRKNETTAKTT